MNLHHSDEGLQPERTLLAWGRTLLAMLVASLLFLRWTPHHGEFAWGLIGLTLLGGLVIWLSQQRRYRHRVTGINQSRFPADVRGVLGLGAMVTLIGAAAIWITLVA